MVSGRPWAHVLNEDHYTCLMESLRGSDVLCKSQEAQTGVIVCDLAPRLEGRLDGREPSSAAALRRTVWSRTSHASPGNHTVHTWWPVPVFISIHKDPNISLQLSSLTRGVTHTLHHLCFCWDLFCAIATKSPWVQSLNVVNCYLFIYFFSIIYSVCPLKKGCPD